MTEVETDFYNTLEYRTNEGIFAAGIPRAIVGILGTSRVWAGAALYILFLINGKLTTSNLLIDQPPLRSIRQRRKRIR